MKKNKIKIIDKSGDRKYFSIIPHYIVNHSDHWEQSLYLVMKRIAGESGTCFASHQTLADKMGASRRTVLRILPRLIKRGWIREIEREGKTKSYEIVDLWEINIEYYKKKKSGDSQSHTQTCDSQSHVPVTPSHTKKKPIKKNINKNNTSNKQVVAVSERGAEITGKEFNDLIALFEPVNPSFERLFPNKAQRAALERMLKKHGHEKIKWVLDRLPEMAKMPYAPVVTTPYQLEQKLGQIIIFLGREANKGGGVIDARHIR